MPRFPKEKIDEQYKKLPDALKDAIFSVDVANKIFEIGKKFALTIEETGFLGEEAGYVMLGLVHPNDFAKSIQARIEVDEEEIQQVAKEVNSQVFYPIRELFKRVHQFEIAAAEEKTAEEKPKEAAPPIKTFEKIKSELQPAPPPLTQRIPPIDLRKPKPEITGGVILNVPPRPASPVSQPQSSVKPEDKKPVAPTPQQSNSEKPPEKPITRRVDPYREAAD